MIPINAFIQNHTLLNIIMFFNYAQRSSISVVRVFEDEIFILSKILLRDEMFDLAINPALRLYNVVG
jgi:hypothetical protein